MKKFSSLFIIIILFLISNSNAQDVKKNTGIFVEPKNEFYEEMIKEIERFNQTAKKESKVFKVDFTNIDVPKTIDEFTYYWHNEPISQGLTGTCWSFSTTSFFESEVYRIHKKKVKLSEMWTAYWEYIEKAKRFIKERGNSAFAEGSEANAVPRIWKQYGIVPLEAYTGLLPGQKFHDHSKMFSEMNSYLQQVKTINAWNENEILETLKSILNHYMGTPPTKFLVEGKEYNPQTYLTNYLKINLDDYVDILSYMQKPYYKQVEYEVPDNWWHSDIYYNVPLDDYMNIIKKAVRNGYTIVIGGDVSEVGYDSKTQCAIIPTFDIPSEYIDENARQFRFSNGTTGDDHGLHLVGYQTRNGKDWFLIKDSGASSRNGLNKGYYFYHEDYIKLKIMDFMIHKDAVKDLLIKFK